MNFRELATNNKRGSVSEVHPKSQTKYLIKQPRGLAVCEPQAESTVVNSTYTVDFSATTNLEEIFSLSYGWSYSRQIPDTTIKCQYGSTSVLWTVDLQTGAEEEAVTFEPGVTLGCPSAKSEIEIGVYVGYDLNSWDTLVETIEINRTIKCSPTNLKLVP